MQIKAAGKSHTHYVKLGQNVGNTKKLIFQMFNTNNSECSKKPNHHYFTIDGSFQLKFLFENFLDVILNDNDTWGEYPVSNGQLVKFVCNHSKPLCTIS